VKIVPIMNMTITMIAIVAALIWTKMKWKSFCPIPTTVAPISSCTTNMEWLENRIDTTNEHTL